MRFLHRARFRAGVKILITYETRKPKKSNHVILACWEEVK